MSPETKNIPTAKPPIPITNPPGIMDEKTYQQYKIKARKILIRSILITLSTLIAWSIYALICGHDFINFSRTLLVIILGSWFYAINKVILHSKYKIPILCRCNNFSSSKDIYSWNSTNNDIWRDNDPTAPGSLASWARERRHG